MYLQAWRRGRLTGVQLKEETHMLKEG